MTYNAKTVRSNAAADGELLGVQLGRLAIHRNIPVAVVAQELDVTRFVVYNWFSGKNDVGKHLRDKVMAYYQTILNAKTRR